MQGIANAGIGAGFYMSMDPKGPVYPAPTRSALSAMTDQSLTASWVRQNVTSLNVSHLISAF